MKNTFNIPKTVIFIVILIFFIHFPILLQGENSSFPEKTAKDPNIKLQSNPKFIKGKNYYYEQKFAIARVFLEDLTQQYKEDAELYMYLADCLFHLQEYAAALINYRKANDLLGSHAAGKKLKAQNLLIMGYIYQLQNRFDESMAHYELAAMTDVQHWNGYYYKGWIALLKKRSKNEAISAWQEFVIQSPPKNALAKKVQSALDILRKTETQLPPEGAPLSIEEYLQRVGVHLPIPYQPSQKK